jgi:hypothetical protein
MNENGLEMKGVYSVCIAGNVSEFEVMSMSTKYNK